MRIFHVAYYTILKNLRDKKSMASMLLLPIVLILILGTALSGAFKITDLKAIQVCYLNNDKGTMSQYFDDFLSSEEIKDMLEVEKVATIEEGKKLVGNEKVTALILINESYSDDIKSGKKANIEVYTGRYTGFSTSVVKSIIESFVEGANTVGAVQRLNVSQVNYTRTESVVESPITTNGKRPRAIDYYAVTMLVMILMYGTQYGCQGIGEDYLENRGKRVKTTPIKPYEQFIGITLGHVFTVMCQSVVLLLFTKYVYKVNWGNNVPMILLISFTLSSLSIALGIMFTVLIKDRMKATTILSLIVPIMTFLAGGYTPIFVGDSMFARIMYISPNYLAQTAFFNTIYGQPITSNIQLLSTVECVGVLWIITIIFFIISSVSGRRQLA